MIALAVVAIVLAVLIPFGIEAVKRPRLRIEPDVWSAEGPVGWVFAVVRVRNRPLGLPWSLLLRRDSATGCELTAEFREKGQQALKLPEIRCRWSATPQPIRYVLPSRALQEIPDGPGPSAMTTAHYGPRFEFDPQAVSESYRLDVAPSDEGYEAAIAILLPDTGAFAFSAESYAHSFAKPEWRLKHGEYEVTVKAQSGQTRATAVFSLPYLTEDFARFRLVTVS